VEASPLSIVRASAHETTKVKSTPNIATATTANDENKPAIYSGTNEPMKIVAIRICVGQRPLHMAKLFVTMAIRRSRGLSMMRKDITPAALQPKPIAMVNDCLPCAPTFLKMLSRLKATLGRPAAVVSLVPFRTYYFFLKSFKGKSF
jgi:hypothetical protein